MDVKTLITGSGNKFFLANLKFLTLTIFATLPIIFLLLLFPSSLHYYLSPKAIQYLCSTCTCENVNVQFKIEAANLLICCKTCKYFIKHCTHMRSSARTTLVLLEWACVCTFTRTANMSLPVFLSRYVFMQNDYCLFKNIPWI